MEALVLGVCSQAPAPVGLQGRGSLRGAEALT